MFSHSVRLEAIKTAIVEKRFSSYLLYTTITSKLKKKTVETF